ncbi:MAG: glycosyltransferase family 4 protein [Hyphomicrobiaceae bacterium]|nr:glycosyltransferase family 4 protein [Hyphomicrobiaceae bacterium]
MMKIAHLIETIELGGVLRNLETLMTNLPDVEHSRFDVSPRRALPPAVPTDRLAVIHFTASWSKMPFLFALRAMRGKAPIVIVEHSYTENYERFCVPNVERFRTMLKIIYGVADRVVAVSERQAEWLVRIGAVERSRITVIQSSTELSRFSAIAPPAPRAADMPLRVGSLGRYHEQKGYAHLIRAMGQLPAGLATLRLAGVGPYDEMLRAMAAPLSNVTVEGPTSDVPGFLSTLDVVAMPSRWESFGQVALEGRAAARPLIASHCDGLIDQTHPSWGWSVPCDDVGAIADAIVAASKADLAAMGTAARASTVRHLENSMDRWRTVVRELMPQSSQRQAA